MSRHMRLPAFLALLTFTIGTVGCSYWRPMPSADATLQEWEKLKGKRVELTTDGVTTDVKVERVEYPFMYVRLYGIYESAKEQIRVDLREVQQIRVREPDWGMIIIGTTVIVGAVVFVAFVLSVMGDPNYQD
jgi:hypothetical protein